MTRTWRHRCSSHRYRPPIPHGTPAVSRMAHADPADGEPPAAERTAPLVAVQTTALDIVLLLMRLVVCNTAAPRVGSPGKTDETRRPRGSAPEQRSPASPPSLAPLTLRR